MPSVSILHAPRDEALGDKIEAALASVGLSSTRAHAGAGRAAVGGDGDFGAAIVVWTEAAERLVRLHEQALAAMARGALIPVAVGGAQPPDGFENLPPVDLSGWTGAPDDPRWRFVLEEIQLARQRLTIRDGAVWAQPEGDAALNTDGALLRETQPDAPPFLTQPKPKRRYSAKEVALGATAGLVMMTVATALLAPLVLPKPSDFAAQERAAATPHAATDSIADPSQQTPSVLATSQVGGVNAPSTDIIVPAAPEAGDIAVDRADDRAVEPGAPNHDVMGSLIASITQDGASVPVQIAALEPAPEANTAASAAVVEAPKTETFTDCADCPEMAALPPGSFQMGAAKGETGASKAESPRHTVTIANRFAMGAKEVTFAQWDACLADGGCTTAPPDHGWGRGDRPVVSVSYADALDYAAWLSAKAGKTYRLPSEAEWEYAARAGGDGAFSFGPGSDVSVSRANFNGQYPYRGAKGTFRARTMPVASFPPNAFGLFDMHGNAWEWTADCWKADHTGAPADGSAVAGGDCAKRVLKGGAWNTGAWRLRSAHRIGKPANAREFDNGFRVARDMD